MGGDVSTDWLGIHDCFLGRVRLSSLVFYRCVAPENMWLSSIFSVPKDLYAGLMESESCKVEFRDNLDGLSVTELLPKITP